MTLPECIAAVDAVSSRLIAAFERGATADCEELIQHRGQLLEQLSAARDAADEVELQRCRSAFAALLEQDAALQELSRTTRDQVAGECRRLLRHGTGSGSSAPYRPSDPTCLDRKA